VSGDLPRKFVAAALVVVIIVAVLFGMIVGSNLKTTPASTVPTHADIALVVQADMLLGPDNQTHDAFTPCNFTVYAGQTVDLTVYNYDDAPHSFTSSTLNVNFQIPGTATLGVPMVSAFQFTESKAGTYRWWCSLPCDTEDAGWAMTNGTDGQPGQINYMGGYVTVLQG
jgi:hypothetical protein